MRAEDIEHLHVRFAESEYVNRVVWSMNLIARARYARIVRLAELRRRGGQMPKVRRRKRGAKRLL